MAKIPIILISIFLFFGQCKPFSVDLANTIDPDIVLINIEKGDRSFIGKVLLKLDSLKPILIGLDAYFVSKRNPFHDSILASALNKIENDILIYTYDGVKFIKSDPLFASLANETALLQYDYNNRLITNMTPLRMINDSIHESFALKIAKKWKPDIDPGFKIDEEVPIHYTRDINKFFLLTGSSLLETNIEDIDFTNKIFLLGYLGPEDEDKYFTPLRVAGEYKKNEPDTHSPVIVANEIRTILNYNK